MKRLVAALTLASTHAYADELANSPVRAGYEPTGRLFDFEARRHLDVDDGFDPMLTYVVETFAAPQLDKRVVAAGLLMLEVDLALDKLVGSGWGHAYASGLAIHGSSLTDELQDVHGVSGNTAPEDVRLFEAWIEQPIRAFTLRAGLLAADQEFVLAENGSSLLSATFGMTAQFSANVGNPVYPVATPGLSARVEHEPFSARLAVYDGTQLQTHGIPDAVGPASLVIGELEFAPITIGAWHHSDRGDGYYAIANAQLDDNIGTFARVGYSPDGPIGHYIDAGVRIEPGPRPEDLACVGIAFATTPEGPQTLIEATYEIQIAWLTIQPDLQLLMLRERTVGVGGLRGTIVF